MSDGNYDKWLQGKAEQSVDGNCMGDCDDCTLEDKEDCPHYSPKNELDRIEDDR